MILNRFGLSVLLNPDVRHLLAAIARGSAAAAPTPVDGVTEALRGLCVL